MHAHSSSSPSRRSWAILVAAVLPVAVLLAACGGGGSKSAGAVKASSNGDTTTTINRQAALKPFTDCLKAQGINLPANFGQRPAGTPRTTDQPGVTRAPGERRFGLPAGVDPAKAQKAFDACRAKLPQGFGGGFRNNPAFQAYLGCLKDHGVNVPTTVAGSGNNAPRPTIDRSSPAFQQADQTCRALLPNNGQGFGGGGFGRPGGPGGQGSGGSTTPTSSAA